MGNTELLARRHDSHRAQIRLSDRRGGVRTIWSQIKRVQIKFVLQFVERVDSRADILTAICDFFVSNASARLMPHLALNIEVPAEIIQAKRLVEQSRRECMQVEKAPFGPLIGILWACQRDERRTRILRHHVHARPMRIRLQPSSLSGPAQRHYEGPPTFPRRRPFNSKA